MRRLRLSCWALIARAVALLAWALVFASQPLPAPAFLERTHP